MSNKSRFDRRVEAKKRAKGRASRKARERGDLNRRGQPAQRQERKARW